MICSERIEMISAHVDGEVGGPEAAELERHIASCAECAQRVESLRALKHAIARLEGRAAPPEAVHARVEALRFRPVPARRWVRIAGYAAVAAILLTAIGLTRVWTERGDGDPLPAELIADHLRSVPEVMPAEVASSNEGDVARFFRTKVPFDPVVPKLGSARLVGGRLCKIGGRKVQLLFYQVDERRLSLYVSDRPSGMGTCYEDGAHSVCARQIGELTLMLVGPGPGREVRGLLDEATL